MGWSLSHGSQRKVGSVEEAGRGEKEGGEGNEKKREGAEGRAKEIWERGEAEEENGGEGQ